jgi:2-polyprenyl-3-methyl-5-hydroxy-6-metoxy-1,4-benzoquinol methylase
MTTLDSVLSDWRMRKAVRELPPKPRLLDVGTGEGEMFRQATATGIGIDPNACKREPPPGVELVQGWFPAAVDDVPNESFDAVTALAVFEHIPMEEQPAWEQAIARLLVPGGVLVITVPAPAVDKILHTLIWLHLLDGMEHHQHYGFRPADLVPLFAGPQWRQRKHRAFQLGLNHLYVFERTAVPAQVSPDAGEPAAHPRGIAQ